MPEHEPFRTMERGYHAATGRRARQVQRVHVIREVGPPGWEPGSKALCGAGAWGVTHSPAVLRDAPHELPDGLQWCASCIGKLAEKLGRLNEVARLLGAAPGLGAAGD